jgi:hypothetical protein
MTQDQYSQELKAKRSYTSSASKGKELDLL